MAITSNTSGSIFKITGTTATSTSVTDNQIFIKHIYWYNPTTAGHLLSLTDRNGRDIIDCYCDTANVSQIHPIITITDGIYVDDMDSGALFIYTR